jgi:hypothetical protein
VLTSLVEIEVRFGFQAIAGGERRAGGVAPTSCVVFQKYCEPVLAVPA